MFKLKSACASSSCKSLCRRLLQCAITACVSLLTLMVSITASAAIQFQDVTQSSGFTHYSESYGASWGDLNADGWPDLYVSNHREQKGLYLNNTDGTFTDKYRDVARWRAYPTTDTHGAAWGDFNRDGYQDIYLSVGARDNQELYINQAGTLVFTGEPQFNNLYDNVNYRGWEGRLPVWLDFNYDGVMDFIMMLRGVPKIFQQGATGAFTLFNTQTGVQCSNSQYGQLADLTGNRQLELICDDHALWPSRIYDMSTLPFTNVSSVLPKTVAVSDTALGDFDGDLRTDFFMLIGNERLTEAVIASPTRIEAQTIVDGVKEKGFSFQTDGVITLELHWTQRNLSKFFIGAAGVHPTGIGPTDLIKFSLDPADPNVWGNMAHDPAINDGIFIGYDQSTQRWTIAVSPGGNARPAYSLQQTYWFIDTTTSFSNLIQDVPGADLPTRSVLRMNTAGFPDQAQARGVGDFMSCVSSVAGDFDNDMDVDLFMACRGGVSNIENRVYENQGNGTFVRVPLAGGAGGPTGIGVGVSDSVALADYDVDGFLDLFVTNGLNMLPEAPYTTRGGPDKLFHNAGNTNKWIELDLVGTTSNRDGVGAKVYATAGTVTQLREQNGGYHRWTQNQQRIHFGLAANTTVNLHIEWPSGVVDDYSNVPANHLYKVTEGIGYQETVLVSSSSVPCGEPTIDGNVDTATFLWKDCPGGGWHVRTTSAAGTTMYLGNLLSDQSFIGVTPVNLGASDVLDISNPMRIDYNFTTFTAGIDGFDFQLANGAQGCFNVLTPSGSTVLVGSTRLPVSVPLDLVNLGTCTPANVAPVITGQLPLSTVKDTALTLDLSNLTVSDPDNAYPADFTLSVQTGANYTICWHDDYARNRIHRQLDRAGYRQ